MDDIEGEIRSQVARIVASAQARRPLSERVVTGDDGPTRRQVGELGILDALQPDGTGLPYVLAAVEEVAVGLVAPDLLVATLAAMTAAAVSAPPAPPGPTAVAWPGFWPGAVGHEDPVTGRVDHVPAGLTAERLMLVLPDSSGAAVSLVDLADTGREPVPVFDPSRPAAALDLRSAPVRAIGRLDTAGQARLRSAYLVAIAADCLGGMRAALDAAVGYARQRTAFGRSIGAFQAVRHRCADMFVDVETTRAVVRGAVAAVERGQGDALALAAASHAMDAFVRVAESSMLVHGALGFTYECDAHFYARRAYTNAACCGGPDALRTSLASA